MDSSKTGQDLIAQLDNVMKMIEQTRVMNNNMLDLSRKGIKKIPEELLHASSLEYLYLEGNCLTNLPEDFFDRLPNLKWLDLRHNYLLALPSTYIGRHEKIRNLLLEGNELKTLPLELGLVTTLNGLNISNNPLEFPPIEIIERGTQAVLAFLREMLLAKSQGKLPPNDETFICFYPALRIGIKIEDLNLDRKYHSDDSDAELYERKKSSTKREYEGPSSSFDLIGPVPTSAALHRPVLNNLNRQHFKRPIGRSSSGSKKRGLASISDDPIQQKYWEETRLQQLRELKERQDLVLQRRKDTQALTDWRQDGKRLQYSKYLQSMEPGKDFREPAKDAPFGVDSSHMKLPSNEERIKQDVKAAHEKLRTRPVSPGTRKRMEDARLERDVELQRRIREHAVAMQQRRRQPKGTPEEEMAAAQKDLAVAEELQRELAMRRKALEYRFTAFTADYPPKKINI